MAIALIFPAAPVFADSPVELIIKAATNIWRPLRGDDTKKPQGEGVIRETGESGTAGAPRRDKAVAGASRSGWEFMKETFSGPDKRETEENDDRSPEAIRALEDFKTRERMKESLNPVMRTNKRTEVEPEKQNSVPVAAAAQEKPAMDPGKE